MAKMAKHYPFELRSCFYGRTGSVESGLERVPVLPDSSAWSLRTKTWRTAPRFQRLTPMLLRKPA
jgi:hypothetical protein